MYSYYLIFYSLIGVQMLLASFYGEIVKRLVTTKFSYLLVGRINFYTILDWRWLKFSKIFSLRNSLIHVETVFKFYILFLSSRTNKS